MKNQSNTTERGASVSIRVVVALAALFVLPAAATAAESPQIAVSVKNLLTIDTVTSAQLGGALAHLNFPILQQHANGDLVATYVVGQTQSGNQTGRQEISTDGGHTWTSRTVSSGDSGG